MYNNNNVHDSSDELDSGTSSEALAEVLRLLAESLTHFQKVVRLQKHEEKKRKQEERKNLELMVVWRKRMEEKFDAAIRAVNNKVERGAINCRKMVVATKMDVKKSMTNMEKLLAMKIPSSPKKTSLPTASKPSPKKIGVPFPSPSNPTESTITPKRTIPEREISNSVATSSAAPLPVSTPGDLATAHSNSCPPYVRSSSGGHTAVSSPSASGTSADNFSCVSRSTSSILSVLNGDRNSITNKSPLTSSPTFAASTTTTPARRPSTSLIITPKAASPTERNSSTSLTTPILNSSSPLPLPIPKITSSAASTITTASFNVPTSIPNNLYYTSPSSSSHSFFGSNALPITTLSSLPSTACNLSTIPTFLSYALNSALNSPTLSSSAAVETSGISSVKSRLSKEKQLYNAVRCGRLKEIVDLLRNGAKTTYRGENKNSLLHVAVKKSYCKILELLLKRRLHVDSRNSDGQTPLHLAARFNKSTRCARLLVVDGADVNCKDNDGFTPLHYACSQRNKKIENFLFRTECDKRMPAEPQLAPVTSFSTPPIPSTSSMSHIPFLSPIPSTSSTPHIPFLSPIPSTPSPSISSSSFIIKDECENDDIKIIE